jgi:hypothetical protein
VAYRAEIEIAVRGARQLQELRNRIESTSNSIDEINRVLARVSQGTVASFSELSRSLRDAQQNFNDAARGTSTYGRALDDLLAAERSYNTELRERNRLLNNARAAQEASQRVITPGSTGFSSSQYGPAAPPSLIRGGQVQQSWGRFFSEAEEIARDLQSTANTRQGVIKQSWGKFFNEATEVAQDLQTTANTRQGAVKQSWNKFFSEATEVAQELQNTANTRQGVIKQSWNSFFGEAEEVAKGLQNTANTRQGAIKQSWSRFFSEAEEVAKELQNTANTRQGAIKQSWSRFFSEAEEVAKELQNTANTRQGVIKQSWNRFFIEAAEVAQDLQSTADTRQGAIKQSWNRFFNEAAEAAKDLQNTALKARGRRRKEALSNAIIGGAFPLLFGQGIGAAVGGGAGGAAGGLIGGQFGFGLSLVGTALGTAVDTFVANNAKLADSLGDPTAALDALEESGVKVDKALKDNVENLVETGEAYAAQSLVLEEINKNLGTEAVNLLSAYDAETKKLNDQYQQLSRELNAQLLPALVGTVVVFRQLTESVTDFFNSPLGQGILKGITINPTTFLARKQFEFLTQTGREAAAQQAGRVIPLDPSVKRGQEETIEKRNKAIRREQIAHERQLARLEKDRVRSQQKALQDRRKVLLDLLSLEQKINDLSLERIREEGRRLEKQRQSEVDLYKTRIQFEREKMRRINEVESPLVAVNKRLQSLEKINEAEEALFALERSRAELEAERANPATLANVIEMYTKLSKLRKDEYLAEKQALEASKERLMIYGTMASLSAAAGFQVSGDPRGAFVPKDAAGILKGIAGPSFEAGAELNAIVKQEVALARVLEKYQEIGQAAQLTSELVTTGFLDMVTGTKSVEEVFADFLRNLAEMLMKTAQQMIAQYIAIGIARAFGLGQSPAIGTRASDFNLEPFGPLKDIGFAGFANGGNPPVGRPSIVGERGPELFVPKSSGTIVPNHALGGGGVKVETINITVENTGESLSPKAQKQIAGQVQGIVLSTLANERRSGGML